MLVVCYGLLAVVGLVLTWSYNIAYMRENGGLSVIEFFRDGFVNSAAASLTCDIFVVAVAASVWFVVESRRVGIRHGWVFIPLGWAVAMAFAIPLFLAVRERRLAKVG